VSEETLNQETPSVDVPEEEAVAVAVAEIEEVEEDLKPKVSIRDTLTRKAARFYDEGEYTWACTMRP